ncbi:MAG: carboxypeptidase-like regulatory domain-containing protein [Lachnospiraceae bacterium]|nr:carboxypeptidase-like regulatory domain-containing protein [Lachnospiraceae bacterium]
MKNKIWNIVYVAALMGASILGGCGDKEQVEEPVVAEEEGKDGADTGNATETTAEEQQEPTAGTISIKVLAANETGAVSGAEVKLSGEAGELSSTTDDAGNAVFNDVAFGDYTIKCDADGYNGSEMSIHLSETEKKPVVAMVPEATGDDAYVLLTWNGEHDLDLCAFNTDMKEYINIGHPIDSEGNVFLYADHDADLPYEVIYIHNASAEVAKTIYVTEAKNAREGTPSQMEADGVSVRVYNSTGLIYETTAKTDETAALWCPCYTYAGEVYDQQDYISDTANDQYAWISFEEKDAYTADASGVTVSEAEWKAAYLERLIKTISYESDYTKYPYAALIYVDGDSVPELAVTLESDGMGDESALVAVYTYASGQVKTLFEATECDSPQGWYIPKEGLLMEGIEWCIGEGPDDIGQWDIIKWDGKNSDTLWSGSKEADFGFKEDGTYWDKYDFFVNDQAVSEQEYNESIAATGWDEKKAISVVDDAKSYDDMVILLSDGSENTSIPTDLEWRQAYYSLISSIQEDDYISNVYLLVCIDNDDVPELVIYESSYTEVYKYGRRGVEKVAEYNNWGAHGIDHSFYEKSGYHWYGGAGDSVTIEYDEENDTVFGICPMFEGLEPVFDNNKDSYEIYEEINEKGEGINCYMINDTSITEDVYEAKTEWITKCPCKGYDDGLSKKEILQTLGK